MASPPINLYLEKKKDFPNVSGDLLYALENKTTTQAVAESLNALHSTRKNFIKNESSSTSKLALKHQTPQPAFTCSKLTIETLEQGVKYVQS